MTILVMDEGMMWNVVDILVIVGGLLILVVWAVVGFKAVSRHSACYYLKNFIQRSAVVGTAMSGHK